MSLSRKADHGPKDSSSVLVRGGVTSTLISMAVPMLAGTFAMNAYSLTDAWFISRLGTLPLAAMGFIFPVVMLLTCVARGIGSGVTTLVSHSIGRRDHADAARLVSHGVALTLGVTVVMSVGGYFLIGPLFRALGADSKTLPLVAAYMRIWYIGAISMTLPMLGGGVLISVGDSKVASAFMVAGTLINLVLNPILIFGYLGLPAMGICGSALATVIAQAISAIWLVVVLWRRHHLLVRDMSGFGESMQRITTFAIPSVLSMILMPISASVITKILSGFGPEAVAASGAAGRVEMFAFMVPMALGISLTPFISQNFGAKRMDRVRRAQSVTSLFALGYGALMTVVFVMGARAMASMFSADPKVISTLVSYIRIISFGYGMMEVHRYCTFFLTGLHMPISATILDAVRVVLFLIPCSYLGAHFWGITGLFAGRLTTDICVGTIGLVWVSRTLARTVVTGATEEHPSPAQG
jgi:putative MATE family efflux protein